MRYRRIGRLDWSVSEIGYGMFGMGSWTGSDDDESMAALQLAVDLGCTFFDSAWGYGEGRSDRLLGDLVRANPDRRLIAATKIPPRNFQWPTRRGDPLDGAFPPDHVREYAEKCLQNLGLPAIDLLQFHVWEDAWSKDERWLRVVDDLRREGIAHAIGLSLNRWEAWNGLQAVRTGLIDTVQVIYNIFDQAPEDELFPLCRELGVGVIARVPFDEGSLTGTLTLDSTWPADDWRSTYFVPENLASSVARADALWPVVPEDMTMPEMALRFILSDPDVTTVIPGMRSERHVRANIAASDAGPLSPDLVATLRSHRWDREPTEWSQ
jgi:aryl-alcohol dehydrogenase-like predicted oxidoreductase